MLFVLSMNSLFLHGVLYDWLIDIRWACCSRRLRDDGMICYLLVGMFDSLSSDTFAAFDFLNGFFLEDCFGAFIK